MDENTLLAADVGGTKTLLQLLRRDAQSRHGITVLAEQRYPSQAYASLEAMVDEFLAAQHSPYPQAACFAVAGPVSQREGRQTSRLTNLPWQLDSSVMSQALRIPRISLLNDFQAIGYSLDVLDDDELTCLNAVPALPDSPKLVVGAGTGLGVCLVTPDAGHDTSHATEGGHLAFAPLDSQQDALNNYLRERFGRVSNERLLSGKGLENIYRFLLHQAGEAQDSLLGHEDPAAAIGQQALTSKHSLAIDTAQLFLRIYGAVAGDLALACLPRGGVFIAGGIAPKLLPLIQEGGFMRAFSDKGRMSELVSALPVQVITNPHCGLLGAARYVSRQ